MTLASYPDILADAWRTYPSRVAGRDTLPSASYTDPAFTGDLAGCRMASWISAAIRLGRRGRAGRGLPRPEPGAGSAGPGAAQRRRLI